MQKTTSWQASYGLFKIRKILQGVLKIQFLIKNSVTEYLHTEGSLSEKSRIPAVILLPSTCTCAVYVNLCFFKLRMFRYLLNNMADRQNTFRFFRRDRPLYVHTLGRPKYSIFCSYCSQCGYKFLSGLLHESRSGRGIYPHDLCFPSLFRLQCL